MKCKRLIISWIVINVTLFIGFMVISQNQPNASAQAFSSQSHLLNEVRISGQKLTKLNLTGNWYSLTNKDGKKQGEIISIDKDGSLNWWMMGGTGNNTTVTQISNYHHGWYRLKIRYPDNSFVYGYIKKARIKVKKQSQSALYFGISQKKIHNRLPSVMVAIRHQDTLSSSQATKTLTLK